MTEKNRLLGLIGHPVEHSLSAQMHNAAFKDLNLNYSYNLFNVLNSDLDTAIKGAKALGFLGFNITIPYKESVLNSLDEISLNAKAIGAVNTIKYENNIIKGYNTDGLGAVKAIEELINLKDKKVVITGAGGASKAIAYTLCLKEISEIVIVNRNLKRAKDLASSLKSQKNSADYESLLKIETEQIKYNSLESIEKEVKDAEILIDTTPVGLYPNVNENPIILSEKLHSDLLVNDIIYTPLESSLLKEAKKANAKTLSGLKMLVYQGAESFKIWTGKEAPIDLMEKTVLNLLNKEKK